MSGVRLWAARARLALLAVAVLALASVGLVLAGGRGSPGVSPTAGLPTATTSTSPIQSPSPAVTATPAATPTPSPSPQLVADPLTGLLVTPSAAALPVIAVMIDDHVAARPQSGFNAAAIVWQAPAEGGIPRYMLVFHAVVPSQVGPVRSSREYFIEWAAEWRAMYGHAGGSPQALLTLRTHGSGGWVWNADEFAWGPYYRRVDFRVPPHNLYTDGSHLEALANRLRVESAPGAAVWTFGPDAPVAARPVGGSITVKYPYEWITFRYDWRTNTYQRYIDSSEQAQVDAADQALVAPKNVVVLRMAFGPLNDGHPQKHRLEAQDVGHGVAWISTNGITVKGTWRKASPTAPTLLFGPNGRPITLTAGQTFVEVVPLTNSVTVIAGRLSPSPTLKPAGLLPL